MAARTKKGLPVPPGAKAKKPARQSAAVSKMAAARYGEPTMKAQPRLKGPVKMATPVAKVRPTNPSRGGGIDIPKFLGEVGDNLSRAIPSRGASGIVPHTMKNLPKGGVMGVVKKATR